MSPRRHLRDGLLGVLLALAAFAGVLWQVGASDAAPGERPAPDAGPRLLCPLHPEPALGAQAAGSSSTFVQPGRRSTKAS
jgi:hypothetical protein